MPVHSQFKRIAHGLPAKETYYNTTQAITHRIYSSTAFVAISCSCIYLYQTAYAYIEFGMEFPWYGCVVDKSEGMTSLFYIYIYFCCCLFFQCNNGCGTYIWLGLLTWLYFVFFFYYHIIISSVLKWMVDSNLSALLGTFSWFCMEVLLSIVYRSVH